jgi:hypothetical protein
MPSWHYRKRLHGTIESEVCVLLELIVSTSAGMKESTHCKASQNVVKYATETLVRWFDNTVLLAARQYTNRMRTINQSWLVQCDVVSLACMTWSI